VAWRIALALLLVVMVVVAVRVVARWQRPGHPPIELGDLADTPGIVLFTSTDCVSCSSARAIAESLGVPIREVTWELEPSLMERVGVEAAGSVAPGGTLGLSRRNPWSWARVALGSPVPCRSTGT
jgi:hypothetical protein